MIFSSGKEQDEADERLLLFCCPKLRFPKVFEVTAEEDKQAELLLKQLLLRLANVTFSVTVVAMPRTEAASPLSASLAATFLPSVVAVYKVKVLELRRVRMRRLAAARRRGDAVGLTGEESPSPPRCPATPPTGLSPSGPST
jgi:hypothetical protein